MPAVPNTVGKIESVKGWAGYAAGDGLKPFEYTPRPLGEEDIEIKIDCCGMCGSDIHTIDGHWGPAKYPVIVGHEIIGKVISKGSSVTEFNIGDRVGVGAQVLACLQDTCSACTHGNDPHCPSGVFTYNANYKDGKPAFGGYAEAVRVSNKYAFKIPDNIKSTEAAPLMCAGVTVFSPLIKHNAKKGDRVGVVGIGGLGHLALQFAKAIECTVTAFSRGTGKKEQALSLGADNFVDTTNPEELAKAAKSLDILLVTADYTSNQLAQFVSWVDFGGKVVLLSVPSTELKMTPGELIFSEVYVGGSLIAGREHIVRTLEVASAKGVRPMIEEVPMEKCNEAWENFKQGKPRYRYVLVNPSLNE